jgi:hypothetical protein
MATESKMDVEYRADLARTLLRILDNWGLTGEQQVSLLGLPEGTPARAINKFAYGTPFPDDYESLQRANYLLAIQNAVESLFPHNTTAANYWMTTPSHYFVNHTPLDIMLSEGVEGMQRVLNYLNGVEDWD